MVLVCLSSFFFFFLLVACFVLRFFRFVSAFSLLFFPASLLRCFVSIEIFSFRFDAVFVCVPG